MKKFIAIVSISLLFLSCNDGDVIITDFNFEDENLDICGAPGGYVFFNINNSSSAESISLSLAINDILFLESSTEEYVLNGTSTIVNYRKFNDDVSPSYFCSNVPPISPDVISEYIGESGIAHLTTEVTKDDEDGFVETVNDTDTDEDGLFNYFDDDDDGDNVPTLIELGLAYINGEDENPQDSDGDGIYDYLDIDDDNDGVITRYEDTNQDLDPTNDITNPEIGPDYLNNAIANSTTVDQYRAHSYLLKSDISLVISNLLLVNSEETITQETMDFGFKNDVINTTVSITPD